MTVAILLFTTIGWAQQYHDAELDELKGHVKSYTMSNGDGSSTVNFTEEGKYDRDDISNVVYNKKGYLVSCTIDYMGAPCSFTVTYNSKNQPFKQVLSIGEGNITQEYTYNSDGTVKTEKISMTAPEMSQTYTITYSYEPFDSHGNWTRRIATVGNQSETQTRVITYW